MTHLFPSPPSILHLTEPARRWPQWLGRIWARVSYGYRVEPVWLERNAHEIAITGLPAEFDGFKIVQLSDLHCSRQVPQCHIDRAIAAAHAEDADLIAVTGDFVHKGYKHVLAAAKAVGRLKARHGVYAVLGNHDFAVRNALGIRRYPGLHSAIANALADHGVRVLRNEGIHIERNGARLGVAGVDDLWSKACDLGSALDHLLCDTPRVLLAHNPRTVENLNGRRCDLVLSGHTHGGQVHLPGLGRPFLGKRARQFACGLYRVDDTHLYVNKGVGFGFRFRFNTRPEVAVLTLRQA